MKKLIIYFMVVIISLTSGSGDKILNSSAPSSSSSSNGTTNNVVKPKPNISSSSVFSNSVSSNSSSSSDINNDLDFDDDEDIFLEEEYDKLKILLISGHGDLSNDPGAVSNGRYEYKYNQDLVNRIDSKLSDSKYVDVVLENKVGPLNDEIKMLKEDTYDYVISIHFNSGGGSGCEIIVPLGQKDLSLSKEIINNYQENGLPVRKNPIYSKDSTKAYIYRNDAKVYKGIDYFGIIREAQKVGVPSDIIEVEFIDNVKNMNYYDKNKDVYVSAISDAIEDYAISKSI
jgi:N-acetylmuramoyl-L-alanine amidase